MKTNKIANIIRNSKRQIFPSKNEKVREPSQMTPMQNNIEILDSARKTYR